jgi:hypothetical protein
LGTPVSSTNKTDRHDIAEILLKVALNTINQFKTKPLINTTFNHDIAEILLKVVLNTINQTKAKP